MTVERADGAERRSSESTVEAGEQDVRRAVYESLNERRLTRERIIASLLFCPDEDSGGPSAG